MIYVKSVRTRYIQTQRDLRQQEHVYKNASIV